MSEQTTFINIHEKRLSKLFKENPLVIPVKKGEISEKHKILLKEVMKMGEAAIKEKEMKEIEKEMEELE